MIEYFSLAIDEQLSLVQPTVKMAGIMFDLIDRNREHLGKFLDFIDHVQEIKDEEDFLKRKLKGEAEGTDRLLLIAYEAEIIGVVDLYLIDQLNRKAEIGYWLSSTYCRQGMMTKAVNKVTQIAFKEMGLNKLSIVADIENYGSNRVAQNCNYTLVGTQREDQLVNGRYRDMNYYSILKSECINKKNRQ